MSTIQNIDTLIHARWIAPVIPKNRLFEHCSLAINNGKIIALLPRAQAEKQYSATDTVVLDEHLLIPGLINSHNHAAMTLLRGYADDQPLKTWLEEHIWPAEKQWVAEEFVRDGTELAIAEMIKSGTTCFSDMYFFPEQAASVAQSAGIRAQITFPVLDFPSNWAVDADDYINKGLALHDQFRASDTIRIGFGPHAPYTVSDEPLKRIATLANELGAPIQIHLHETAFEVEQSLQQHGMRPTERLQKLGLMSRLTQCVHMTQIDETDIAILKNSGAHVVHCPESNLKLASGFCPVDKLHKAGINTALGTDGAASNNDLDLIQEMRTAALLAKGVAADASACSAHQALQMATINGACALGIDDVTGSLEVGKSADISAIDFSGINSLPIYDPVSQLVYSGNGQQVSHVWCNGKPLLQDGELQTLNQHDIKIKTLNWGQRIGREQ
tara:strand:- start:189 stop:1517 length:1329 start_codon:yes stop_codon:yes gene_type:complete